MFEVCIRDCLFPAAAPTKIFHFTEQPNPNKCFQPDPGHGTNTTTISVVGCVARRKYRIRFRLNFKAHYFISYTELFYKF